MATTSTPKYDIGKFLDSLPKGAHTRTRFGAIWHPPRRGQSRADWEAAIMTRAQADVDQLRRCREPLHCRYQHQHRVSVPKSKPPAPRSTKGQETTRAASVDMVMEGTETEASEGMDIEVPELIDDADAAMDGIQTGEEEEDIEALLNTFKTIQLDEKTEIDVDMAVVGDVDMNWEGPD